MKNRTNSDIIRNSLLMSINTLQTTAANNFRTNNVMDNDLYARTWINNSLYERFTNELNSYDLTLKYYGDEMITKANIVLMVLEEVIFLSDYYIVLTYKSKTQSKDNGVFNIKGILKSIREESFGYITKTLDIVKMADASKEIENASLSQKTSIFSSLDETDIEFLSSINPFFEEEYELYAPNDTPEVGDEKKKKQQVSNLLDNTIYQEMARFLANPYGVDENLIDDVIADILETLEINGEDIKTMIGVLGYNSIDDIDQVIIFLIEKYYQVKKDEKDYEK